MAGRAGVSPTTDSIRTRYVPSTKLQARRMRCRAWLRATSSRPRFRSAATLGLTTTSHCSTLTYATASLVETPTARGIADPESLFGTCDSLLRGFSLGLSLHTLHLGHLRVPLACEGGLPPSDHGQLFLLQKYASSEARHEVGSGIIR